MTHLLVASKNTGKVREIRTVLGDLEGWTVAALPADAPEMEETGATFLENARQKCAFYGRLYGGWTLADDSGLAVDALDGRPGIFSARYAPTDAERNRKLLAELEGVPDDARGAAFVCALALAFAGQIRWDIEERVRGRIAMAPCGSRGFGYDPIFWLPDRRQTMSEIEPALKNRISHRGRALARLLQHLDGFAP